MITLSPHQTKAAAESYNNYTGRHKVSFQEMKKMFVAEFSKIPRWDFKPGEFVGNAFYDFVEDYYFDLRKQEVKAPIKYELKPQIELIELNAQLNEHNNELKICAKCGREFAGIKALHGHLRTCKPN